MSHADTLGDALKAAIHDTDTTGLTFDNALKEVWRAAAHELLSGSLAPRTAMISWDQVSQSSVAGGSHVEFTDADGALVDAGLVSLSTGSGQSKGIVTLSSGLAYRVECVINGDTVNSGFRTARLRHSDGSEVSDINRSGTNANSVYAIDSDLADTRRARGHISMFETGALASSEDVVMEFVSGWGSLISCYMFITEVAP